MCFRIIFFFLCVFLISGCDNSEKEARVLLNQAIKDWDAGDITGAEQKFDLIENEYLETSVATESIKERGLRKEKYKQENDVAISRKQNRGHFSRKVVQNIDAYHNVENKYPESLSMLEWNDISDAEKYLALCTYQKALFDYGYQLNCDAADKIYREEKLVLRKQNTSSEPVDKKEQINLLENYPKANTTWGDKFNPQKVAPKDGFKAYYFSTNDPEKVIANESVQEVRINYIHDKFHNIKSQDFGAYWLGNIYLEKKEVKRVAINQSWAKTRLIIDGHVVYEGGSNKEILLTLEPGNHLVEVEYVNNWHTTEFSLVFIDQVAKLSLAEIEQRLKANLLGDYDIYYAGLYESDKTDLSVVLNMEKTSKQIVLFLSSYSPIKWYISNPFEVDIRAIVYGSYSPGTTIVGDINSATLLLPAEGQIGSYSTTQRCSCAGSHFHCEGGTLLSTKQAVEKVGRSRLTGFSGTYSAGYLRLPEIIVNERYIQDLENKSKEIEAARNSCKKQNNPDFEKMFNIGGDI
jgi:hypothetical protein